MGFAGRATSSSRRSDSPRCSLQVSSVRARLEPRLVNDRLEQLHRVARWVVDQDLLAADAGDDVVAELGARFAQNPNEPLEVGNFDREAFPAAGFGPAAVGHWLRPA